MLSVHQRIAFLQRTSLFADLEEDLLADIANLLQEVEVRAGETVFTTGENGTCMYIIAAGRIRIVDGDVPIDDLRAEEVFGEMAVLDPAPRVATAMAVVDTTLLRLDQAPFSSLMEARFEVTRQVLAVLCRRLRARVKDITDLKSRV